jgi:hypothetical protein
LNARSSSLLERHDDLPEGVHNLGIRCMSIFPLTTTSCRTTDREAEAQAIVDEHSVAAPRLTVQSLVAFVG